MPFLKRKSESWLSRLKGTTTYPQHTDKHNPRYSVGVLVPIVLVVALESGSFFKRMTIAKTLYFQM